MDADLVHRLLLVWLVPGTILLGLTLWFSMYVADVQKRRAIRVIAGGVGFAPTILPVREAGLYPGPAWFAVFMCITQPDIPLWVGFAFGLVPIAIASWIVWGFTNLNDWSRQKL